MPNPVQVGYLTVTIADTAGTMLSIGSTTKPGLAQSFVGRLATAQIRMRGDGTAPTTSEGVLINVGDIIYLSENEINNMQFIRTGSVSGVIKGHYFSAQLPQLLGAGSS